MVSEKKQSILEKFIIFSEVNVKTIKFAKFRKPSNIPSHFLKKRVPLQGTVAHIEPSHGTLLMVDHKPLIPLPRLHSSTYLPVKIAGVDVTANGVNWLQTIVNKKQITFIPLAKDKEYLSCAVTVLQQNQEKIKIEEELVRLGFGLIREDFFNSVPKDKKISKYQKRLLRAQKWAQRKRNGHWHFATIPTLLWKVQQSLAENVKSILPTFLIKQLNI
ncbi:protein C3orf33 homolog isoform X2 [Calliopsis andreniformis]|uniref:protein C3orf33 homolog isoform X2 n=1 Tax=Calliopsis andreniformis TaxID=337506 RepID=UPI003FCD43B6